LSRPALVFAAPLFGPVSALLSLIPPWPPPPQTLFPVPRPRPDPPRVMSPFFFLISPPPSRFGLGFLELPFPVEPARLGARRFGFLYHALLLVEHAQVGECEDVVGLVLDVFVGRRDGGVEIAERLVT